MYDTDYDHIWRNAFLRATPIVFNMVCVLLIGLAPLYLILRTRQEMTQILTTSTTELNESDSIRDLSNLSFDEESLY
tara:strand:+ start:297 stop:527 length:231 start_codon:yes stop_codon:yes gene_type:complete